MRSRCIPLRCRLALQRSMSAAKISGQIWPCCATSCSRSITRCCAIRACRRLTQMTDDLSHEQLLAYTRHLEAEMMRALRILAAITTHLQAFNTLMKEDLEKSVFGEPLPPDSTEHRQ